MKKLEGEEEPRGDELQLGVLSNLKRGKYEEKSVILPI